MGPRIVQIPKITDNDAGEITATINGNEIRGWSYKDAAEHRTKMLMAHEFAEGWFHAREVCATLAGAQEDQSNKAAYEFDGGSGSMGYESACRDIAAAIRD